MEWINYRHGKEIVVVKFAWVRDGVEKSQTRLGNCCREVCMGRRWSGEIIDKVRKLLL